VPFGFLKRKPAEEAAPTAKPAAASTAPAAPDPMHRGAPRGVAFTAITEDWRIRGRMEITGRLSDALNKREAIAISDVSWGSPEVGSKLDPAPGLKSVDPYDLILVTAGEDSLPPLSETERAALRVHKVAYLVALEVPPFRVTGTVYMHPGSDPERLLDRSTEMFVPVVDGSARLGGQPVSDEGQDVILVNRFYLRGVGQVDPAPDGGAGHAPSPGNPPSDAAPSPGNPPADAAPPPAAG
jgi:hypothetical protein